MTRFALRVLWLATLVAAVCAAPALAATKPIAVLLLDGQSGGPYHQWRVTTPILKKELEETGRFQVTVATSPQTGEDFSGFKPKFGDYQVVVSNLDAPDWPADLRSALEQFVKNGGGLVVVHAADNSFPNWPEYNRMTGIGGWRGRNEKSGPLWYFKDGKLVSDNTPGPAGAHGARLPFQVETRDAEHPIMKGLPHVWMHAADELYGTLRGPGEGMTVLATAHSDPANRGTGHDEPMLMVLKYGKGRVFHTAMGHDAAALGCVGFMTTYQRGTEWAATGKVTQKVPANFPTANTSSVRVDIAFLNRPAPARGFDELADAALVAMRKRAGELGIGGAAVVAYFEGDSIHSWRSRMAVVGRMKDEPSATNKGSNLLAIAYAKASEMADTLKDSGSNVRPPMTGEFGWEGGVIVRGKAGYLIAAFSGGQSADDVQVSRAGVAVLKAGL
jgi:type 1 glutamine amidotransferase/uncharacterized protein GlcG (DUF336 family)